jgi:hypothetical protein
MAIDRFESAQYRPTMTLVAQAVQTLRLDAIAADLVTALRERGIEPVLLKGPALARRLYRPEPV